MEKDKNLEELLAAIGGNETPAAPALNFTQPTSSAIPIPTVGIPPNTVPPRTQNSNSSSVGNLAGNLDELVNLLGASSNARPAMPAALPNQVAAGNAFAPNALEAMSRQRNMAQRQIPGRLPAGLDQKAAAQFQRQQIEAAKAMKNREAAMAAKSNRLPMSTMNPAKTTASGGDITDELKAVMQTTSSAEGGKVAAPRSGNAAQRRAAARPRPGQQQASGAKGQRPMQPDQRVTQSSSSGRQQRQITQEQIILGHFCRHAIKTLGRVMNGNPARQQAEGQLRDHIKTVWAQWVRGMIPRQRLLESVASFVKTSCPEALHLDVIGEFKVWYEREFELQRRRTAAEAEKARRQQHSQQQQPQAIQSRQNQTSPAKQEAKIQAVRTAASARDKASQARMSMAGAAAAGRGTSLSTQVMKPENQLPEAQPRHGKADSQHSQGRTGGKSIPNKALPPRKTPAKNTKAGGAKAVAGKTVGSKSVGSKTVSRQPIVPNIVPVGVPGQAHSALKGPTTPNAAQMGDAKGGGVGGKHIAGNKGLVSNKMPNLPKPKGQRKQAAKTAQKTASKKPKISPKTALSASMAKQKGPPSVNASGMSPGMAPGGLPTPITGKRPLDTGVNSPAGSVPKKAKGTSKGPKGNMSKKKNAGVLPPSSTGKDDRPPPARADMGKGRPPVGPGGVPSNASGQGGDGKGGQTTAGAGNSGQVQVKRAKGVDDELSVVHNVVDIENEEDMLGRDAGAGTADVVEEIDYDSDLLLAGPALRSKMQYAAKKHGMDHAIGKEVMEMMSLAVRERLASVIESLKEIADVRTEANRQEWITEAVGPNIREKLDWMRMDEERALVKAAELRIKKRKEEQEREAKRLAGEAEKEEKKTKDSSAAGDQERKEKLALEKKRKEHNSQRDALSGLLAGIDKRRKKPNAGKGLAALVPLSKLGSSGKDGLSRLPPIQRVAGSGLPEIGKGKGSEKKGGSKVDPLEKMGPQGPLIALGGGNRFPGLKGLVGKKGGTKGGGNVPKRALTMKDCLFFMESSHSMRKSTLLYKWYGRMGIQALKDAAVE